MKQQILFVDDEPNLLHGLQRMLRPMRQSWDMYFAESGPDALRIIDQHPCDVVVSDMRMPGMDGSQLLREIRQHSPETARFILSGYSELSMILRSVGATHQFLAKPCDDDTLKTTLDRVCRLRHLLPDTSLLRLVTSIDRLPSLPCLYHQVVEALQKPAPELTAIANVIACDMGMTAKMLQIVHSAFFALQRQLSSPIQAVELLGLDTLQALVLNAQVFTAAQEQTACDSPLSTLWTHSLAMAICARAIMAAEGGSATELDETFAAGLLHDVGTLVFISHLRELYDDSRHLSAAENLPAHRAERDVIGATHAQVGAYLMGLWGLSDVIIDALAYHHEPSACPTQTWSPLAAVHVAEALMHDYMPDQLAGAAPALDAGYLEALGLRHRLPVWRQCVQDALRPHISADGLAIFHLQPEVAAHA